MTEFLDFLRHKYAYVAIGEFKPGSFAEARQLYEKSSVNLYRGIQGRLFAPGNPARIEELR